MATKRHRLARRRKTLGFTQEELAERIGVDPSTIRRWESGASKTGPTPHLRAKLATVLQVSPEQLDALLHEDGDVRGESAAWSSVRQSEGDSHRGGQQPGSNPGGEVVLPVLIGGRVNLVPLGVGTAGEYSMRLVTRRSALGYSLVVAAAATHAANGGAQAHGPTPSWATATYEAVLNPVEAMRSATTDNDVPPLSTLRRMVDYTVRVSLTSDYGALEQVLPRLLGQLEMASLQRGDDEECKQVSSDLYAVVGWMLIKADLSTGAQIAAERALAAAQQAEDVLRVAAATRCFAEAQMRAGQLESATRTSLLAAVQLEGNAVVDQPAALSLRGAALLSAAAASARRGDRREAQVSLKAAAGIADILKHDRSDLGTVFGPTNVAIHQVAIPMELGDAREAARQVSGVDLGRVPAALSERRSRFLIDVARSYAGLGNDTAAIDALVDAERASPHELRHHRLTRALIPELLTRERRSSKLRALAGRCGVLG
ncbi:hypothetical protein BU204_36500 [Actinophytocola xanthii]|uniref:HTH cro/C1-type domain-containing protein n=2 Tax=Actinophytocola xanthii TaxID=1912961 RepID=A0A1Q8BVX5_9PSEU|nr:hypothetical protein BU204_36500 [Actinophytocola xanthii]